MWSCFLCPWVVFLPPSSWLFLIYHQITYSSLNSYSSELVYRHFPLHSSYPSAQTRVPSQTRLFNHPRPRATQRSVSLVLCWHRGLLPRVCTPSAPCSSITELQTAASSCHSDAVSLPLCLINVMRLSVNYILKDCREFIRVWRIMVEHADDDSLGVFKHQNNF